MCAAQVLHRDIKPSNILLDEQDNAKISDCGLASVVSESQHMLARDQTTRIVGTIGYIDPLYMDTGMQGPITDAYAIGMSLLVCLTGRHVLEAKRAAECMREDFARAIDCADPRAEWPADVATALAKVVAGLSWKQHPHLRMKLSDATAELERLASEHDLRRGMAETPQRERECVSCMSAPTAVRFMCGHCVLCEGCVNTMLASPQVALHVCPICRQHVTESNIVARGVHLNLENTFELVLT